MTTYVRTLQGGYLFLQHLDGDEAEQKGRIKRCGKTYRGSESSGCRKYLLQTSGLLWFSAAQGLARKLRLVALEIGTDGRALLG